MKKTYFFLLALASVFAVACQGEQDKGFKLSGIKEFYKAAPEGVRTRWVSAENPNATKGKGGTTNKGAKGDAYILLGPGEKAVIFDQKGAGIITKMWVASSIQWKSPADRRKMKIEMFWDDAKKPAVSVPFTDFFGIGHGMVRKFESELFAMPEGKSFNSFIPMPYRKAGRIEVTNDTDDQLMFYYKIDFLEVPRHDDNVMYFHAYWNRDLKTDLGEDYEILPRVSGRGRYLGTNIGVLGDSIYKGTWFGEGEVKVFLDGDKDLPTLVGTGTEDYIGSGWGQGEYANMVQGSLVSDKGKDIYAFYRYHTKDPVYFHKDCRVTIQQMGNARKPKLMAIRKAGGEFKVLWSYVGKDGKQASKRYLDMKNPPKLEDDNFPVAPTTFYRRDDVSATAYFYLDKPQSELPGLPDMEVRTANLSERGVK
ncbi:hypothetical protein FUAX_07660 [Fulvitalea axinellae]|uniref:DUF2961 domain-containing protein n=1 Tax=Fulvitalea axinellae TaxID=1182444 RepID=A0AAU9CPP5_9BACT|nr:hypothetical protein FUAX_07660 [Fulvitalea axinellae]